MRTVFNGGGGGVSIPDTQTDGRNARRRTFDTVRRKSRQSKRQTKEYVFSVNTSGEV